MIPLHVLDAVKESKVKAINVRSPSTDVLILVIDVAARGHLGEFNTLRLLTGREAKYWAIDVQERVSIIGREKSKELIVFHHFTGSNWGGKFVGVSKRHEFWLVCHWHLMMKSYKHWPKWAKMLTRIQRHCSKLTCLKGTAHQKGLYARFIQLRVT